MAGSKPITLDTVVMTIETEAGKAGENIDALSAKLAHLKESIRGGFGNLLQLQKGLESINKIPDIMAKFDASTFENFKRVSSELATSLEPLATKMQQVADGYSAFSKIQNTFGKSASTITRYAKQQQSTFKSLSSTIGGVSSRFGELSRNISSAFGKTSLTNLQKFYSKFKQIFLSLLGTRTLFTMIRKAVSEYQAFDTTLRDFSQNIWRAFGAQLAPIIEYVMGLFKQFVRVIYSVVYAITGIDLIARANAKAMASWGKSAKDTLGSLQKFDDLNVVEFDKDKGDDNKLIEMDKIDLSPIQPVITAVKKLKKEINNAFKTGKWRAVGKSLANVINNVFDLIDVNKIEQKLIVVGENFGNIIGGVLQDLNFSSIGDKLGKLFTSILNALTVSLQQILWSSFGEGLTDLLLSLDFSALVNSFDNLVSTILISINNIFVGINRKWGEIKREARETGEAIANVLNSVLTDIKWSVIIKSFTEGINSLLILINTTFNNFDWTKLGTNIGNIINTFFKTFSFSSLIDSINSFTHGLFTSVSTAIDKIEWDLIGETIVRMLLDVDWAQLALDMVIFAESLFNAIVKGITGIGRSIYEEIFGSSDEIEKEGQSLGDRFAFALRQAATRRLLSGQDPISQFLGWCRGFLEGWLMTREKESPVKMGEDIGAGIVGGINVGLKDMWKINKPNFKTFKDSVLSFFGIHSPSTWARDEIAANLISGMKNGLSKLWTQTKTTFSNFMNNISSSFSKNNFIKLGENIVSGIQSGLSKLGSIISSVFRNAFNGAIDVVNSISSKINSNFKISIGSTLSDALGALGINIGKGTYQFISIPSIPRLATGTNEIPYEGLYHLHPGEAVVPKKYNPALGGGSNEETNARLDTLIALMNNMNTTTVVNIGNRKVYEGQARYNKQQQNKYGTINLY